MEVVSLGFVDKICVLHQLLGVMESKEVMETPYLIFCNENDSIDG
jgi:hypothetical protein